MNTVSGKTNAVCHSSSALDVVFCSAFEPEPEMASEALLEPEPEIALKEEALLGRRSDPPECDFFESRTRGWYLCIEFKTI